MTDTYPLVMVIGGYTEVEEGRGIVPRKFGGGPSNHIEIISPSKNCRKGVAPAIDVKTDSDIGTFNDAEFIGATGQYTKEVPIYCGGKGRLDNFDTCWEYNFRSNR